MKETLVALTPALTPVAVHGPQVPTVARLGQIKSHSPHHHGKRKLISALLIIVSCTCSETLLMQGNRCRGYAIFPSLLHSLYAASVYTTVRLATHLSTRSRHQHPSSRWAAPGIAQLNLAEERSNTALNLMLCVTYRVRLAM
jgi:hypothetical protein